MSYKSILVQAEPGEHAVGRIDCAAALAGRFAAALLGVAAECPVPTSLAESGVYAGEWDGALEAQIEADLKAAEEVFRSRGGGRLTSWRTYRTLPAQALAEASRGADLIVAGGSLSRDRGVHISADIAQLVLLSGRPVLVAPPRGGICLANRVVIAWSDGRESRRAAADAMPFLRGADQVVVLEICKPDDLSAAEERTAEVALGLVRHGVKASNQVLARSRDEVGAVLIDYARGLGADLIVAGGYGHSPMAEWIFGGVTRDLLRQTERFVLLSH